MMYIIFPWKYIDSETSITVACLQSPSPLVVLLYLLINNKTSADVICYLYISLLLFPEKKEVPKFVRKLENIETVEKKTVKFEAEVSGKPKPHVTW